MRKIPLSLFVLFAAIGFSTQAKANPGQKAACETSGGVWHPLARTPQCDCSARNDLFSLLAPGPTAALQRINALAFVKADVCESRDLKKTSSNIKKAAPKPPAPPAPPVVVPPPSCSLAQSSIEAKANEPALNMLICTGAVARINKIVTTCDNCKGPDDERVKLSKADDNYTYRVKVTAEPGTKSSLVSVNVVGKSLNSQLTYKVAWELSACAKQPSGGTDAGNTCLCPSGKHVELNADGQPVCVKDEPKVVVTKPEPPKVETPKPAVVKAKSFLGGIVHPLIEPKCLMVKSDTFETSECFMDLGLTADILDWLKWYGTIGMGTPGATNTDSNGVAVKLSNGKDDKRKLSILIETGLRFRLYDPLGLRAGGFRRMDGETNGIEHPVHVSTGGLLGLDLNFKVESHTMGLGLAGTLGSHQKGSMNSNAEYGVMFNLWLELWTGK